jgi:hypothetical protein
LAKVSQETEGLRDHFWAWWTSIGSSSKGSRN